MEIWKPIEGYEDSYEISNLGRVRSVDRFTPTWNGQVFKKGVIKTPKEDKDGYYKVWLSKESKKRPFFVHRLVAKAFIPNPHDFPIVNHIDGDKKNNVPSNLEWCTRSHNDKHAFQHGLRVPSDGGTSKPVAKIDPNSEAIIEIYRSISEAARKNDVTTSMIWSAANGKSRTAKGFKWAFVSEGVTTIESAS
jgi:hypothetical protein